MVPLLALLLLTQVDGEADAVATSQANARAFRDAAAKVAKAKRLELLDVELPAQVERPGFKLVRVGAWHEPLAEERAASAPLLARDPKSKRLRLLVPRPRAKRTVKVLVTCLPPDAPPPPLQELRALVPEALAPPGDAELDEDLAVTFDAVGLERRCRP